ncbi:MULTISPECIES: lysozyme inhibitor LprI family protein [unclassified Sphingomonas]|uniref:lysozyme inhibitor LprI family protein n=1 Tax=unclassified Sphingomonas TaxID=196159 RepID=UPI00226A4055|nr:MULTISPECIES: lysozyme inhibitor LprI family protein [unclassified Sphingomonas]
MKTLAVLALLLVPASVLAQTAEDAHVQHMGRLADTALNAQYHRTMAAMALADKEREVGLKDGSSKPDGHPTYQAALLAAERNWLAYRDAHCETVGLGYRGGAYEDEADGKCVNELDRKRTAELKTVLDGMSH